MAVANTPIRRQEAPRLRHPTRQRFRQQVPFLRRQFLRDGDLPFPDVLTEEGIAQALAAGTGCLDRISSPPVTPRVFPGQALSADPCCRAAVARRIAPRWARGQRPCAAPAGAYCQARRRLPEPSFADVARQAGRAPEAAVDPRRLWKGRRVCLFDGTAVSTPDAPENQEADPRVYDQKPGLGFPIARLGAITSLAGGAIAEPGVRRYAGKGRGEVGLLRRRWDALRPGGLLLTDAGMADWTSVVMRKGRGIEPVGRLNEAHRTADFRRGERLGPPDHVAHGRKPTSIRPLDRRSRQAPPESVTVREARARVAQPGFRAKAVVVVTTLPGPRRATKGEPAALYRARWHNELDLRSVKSAMQMGESRCKTPAVVRKETWAPVPAHGLIRTAMAQAAATHGLAPRSISFKGAPQTPEAFQPPLELRAGRGRAHRVGLYQDLLRAIATHRAADRPDRFAPRRKKRRRNNCDWLTSPRGEVKRKMAKGLVVI